MNLDQKIKQQGKISEIEALRLFLQILEGYYEIKKKGYIHRDVKPENILVKEGKIKLADFGFSTQLRQISVRETFNVGTPLYMAPETLTSNIYS